MTSPGRRVDPRTRRTLAALRRALTELVSHTPLSQITVAELCRTAGVHRTTFYQHFDTVAEVAGTVVGQVLRGITAQRPAGEADGLVAYRLWLTALLEHMQDNRQIYAGLLGPEGDPGLVRAVCDAFVARAEHHLRADVEHGAELGTDAGVAARVLGFASWGAVEAVLLRGEDAARIGVDEVAAVADALLGALRELIAEPAAA
ncbi:TetR/AcrR family transcriptional regulator [Georgenia sp. SYP-B2076]|uniref:TetR/AcrR family transcriptional regulator n=1 Tax=Georgenia sp. SYP-B2076 TaxID=2495881 RepID=UPI000F8D1845|nr:TetR/AcrR family transcriptional regulator [Georgenia sp. SYP-B2076]